MRRIPQRLLIFIVVFCLPTFGQAQDGAYKKSQYYRGITFSHVVTSVIEDDVDGDGSKEVLVCYKEQGDSVNQPGGILILSNSVQGYIVAWHALFENVYPKSVVVSGGSLTFELVQTTMQADKTISKVFVKGKDFFFRDDEKGPYAGVKIEASSTLRSDTVSTANIFDRDLETSWAEGMEGTGVDETVTFEFPKPVNLGLIGVLHGNYKGRRFWNDNNRIHRAEVTVETSSDRYDTESDVDFEADLGLGLYGDKIELNFSNKPVMRYFKLGKKSVLSLELKITSVLLGEKNDDTHIAEIDFAEMIPSSVIFGTAKPSKKDKPQKPIENKKEEEPDDWTDDDGF
ncbi:MAG: hypothetical protein JRJ19_02420 [Deltaproteobacteria bacterium]|nr:hypothetical protein [Deltaproteobacteria bacterium]